MVKEEACISWEDFQDKAQAQIFRGEELAKSKYPFIRHPGLFRGQSDAFFLLKTTLERFFEENSKDGRFPGVGFNVLQYDQRLAAVYPAFVSQSDVATKLKAQYHYELDCQNYNFELPNYNLMVYLRHLGFPSPLLDWSRSFYVAAYFAFSFAKKDQDVAIYFYREFSADMKFQRVGSTRIIGKGPYAVTHSRHYIQQCEYTVCIRLEKKAINDGNSQYNPYYMSHEDGDFSDTEADQNFLIKYTLPSSERRKVLKHLNSMNINRYSLFSDQEGLAQSLGYIELMKDVDRFDRGT